MCPAHHKVIDDNPEEWTVERLLEVKREHEAQHVDAVVPPLSDTQAQALLNQLLGLVQSVLDILRGFDELPTRYDARVRNCLEYYLGTPDQPAPFGGRQADLERLDAWLAEPEAPNYTLLTAPAGRGKSALLAHWIAHLEGRTDDDHPHIIYWPVSVRFNTNLEGVAFAALAARMAHLHGEPIAGDWNAGTYRGMFSDFLRRPPSDGRRVLVILDGLDEAAGWSVGADLFPLIPPPHLRVLVAARPLAGDADESAWLTRLGWEASGRAQMLSLGGLDQEGVRDVLAQMGDPLDALAPQVDVVSRLYELSEGDPLLVRLYVEALLPHGEEAAHFTPEDLETLQPGLKAYMERWFEEQRKLWGPSSPLREKPVRGLLNLCATALGPLMKDDVHTLAPDFIEDGLLLEEAARAVERFVIGDGVDSGYVFGHPRLGEYFLGRLSEGERRDWQDRFLAYGHEVLRDLEAGTLLPRDAPTYVVRHYGAHLEDAEAPDDDVYGLMCEEWLRAWEWVEGVAAGFLTDVDRAWRRAEAAEPALLGQQVRAALCLASEASASANVPGELLEACVKEGVIGVTQALALARKKPDPNDFIKTMTRLAPYLPARMVGEVLEMAHKVRDQASRARALLALAPNLPTIEKEKLLVEALAIARGIDSEYTRIDVLSTLATCLPTAKIDEALEIARGIEKRSLRAEALSVLALRLPTTEKEKVLAEALAIARRIDNEYTRIDVLSTLATCLPTAKTDEALRIARGVDDDFVRAQALLELVPHLPPTEREEVLREALQIAREMGYGPSRLTVLLGLANQLSVIEREEVVCEALHIARAMGYEPSRFTVLLGLAQHTLARRQPEVPGDILHIAHGLGDAKLCVEALPILAPHLSGAMMGKALGIARGLDDELLRAQVLCDLVPHLPVEEREEVVCEVLQVACKIGEEDPYGCVESELVWHLPAGQQDEVVFKALELVRGIKDQIDRAWELSDLVLHLPARKCLEALDEALEIAAGIGNDDFRAWAFSDLVPRLPPAMLGKALKISRGIRDEYPRVQALANLVPHLPMGECEEVLGEALATACRIGEEDSRVKALSELVQHLPAAMMSKALEIAHGIEGKALRAKALSVLLPHLPPREREKVLGEALEIACELKNKYERAGVLSDLVPHFPLGEWAKVLGESLEIAYAMNYEYPSEAAVSTPVPRLPIADLKDMLKMARTAPRAEQSAASLYTIASHWQEMYNACSLCESNELSTTLRAFAHAGRTQLLDVIRALSPVIARLGGASAIREAAQAIVDTAEWWP
jgi:hypothetical protein